MARAAQGLRIRRQTEHMRYVPLVVGGLMALTGGVWLLQGVDVLPGSFMTGQAFWAAVGATTLVAGAILVFAGFRPDKRR